MQENPCAVYTQLQLHVNSVLVKLVELSQAIHGAFLNGDESEVSRLDRELEGEIGRKERALGALRQHVKEHECVPSRSRQLE